MLERFTKDAREVVRGAVERAVRSGATSVEPGHVLLALLDRESGRASFALTALGARERRDSIEQALRAAHRHAGLSQADAEALAGLGIDLVEIISRIEQVHGAGAMAEGTQAFESSDEEPDDGGRKKRGRGRMTRRRLSGHRPLTPDARDILINALRMATGHHDRHIGDEHLLLALLARPGIPTEVLAEHGVTYGSVERVLYGPGSAGEYRNQAS
jgi:ATP-dependent Clp protease ATP-binding subunit ClpA